MTSSCRTWCIYICDILNVWFLFHSPVLFNDYTGKMMHENLDTTLRAVRAILWAWVEHGSWFKLTKVTIVFWRIYIYIYLQTRFQHITIDCCSGSTVAMDWLFCLQNNFTTRWDSCCLSKNKNTTINEWIKSWLHKDPVHIARFTCTIKINELLCPHYQKIFYDLFCSTFSCGFVQIRFTHFTLQDYFIIAIWTILRLPQIQWSNRQGYG